MWAAVGVSLGVRFRSWRRNFRIPIRSVPYFGSIQAWFRELPTGILDSLTREQVMHCNTEEECTQLVKLLAPTEAALLDWAINLMADVVLHEAYNKMNARNIAMVFAPNMTQVCYFTWYDSFNFHLWNKSDRR